MVEVAATVGGAAMVDVERGVAVGGELRSQGFGGDACISSV